jgi:hypothetical protein
MMIASTICSLHVCYGFRLNGQDKEKAEMFEILFKWTSYMHTFCRLKPKNVNSCILDVATFFLKGIDLEENISDNVPFKENFIAMLVCINTLTPLIIVGAPGASKTLSSQVLLKHLQERRNFFDEEVKKDFTLTEKPVDVRFFAGTELTTPQEIKQVFEKAKQVSKQVTGLVFIDELGLAEISEKNPLKVLHPYLEAKDRDYAFVGISNWVLDLSKMNRMIFLARPELSSTELMAIFEKYMSTGIRQEDQEVSLK